MSDEASILTSIDIPCSQNVTLESESFIPTLQSPSCKAWTSCKQKSRVNLVRWKDWEQQQIEVLYSNILISIMNKEATTGSTPSSVVHHSKDPCWIQDIHLHLDMSRIHLENLAIDWSARVQFCSREGHKIFRKLYRTILEEAHLASMTSSSLSWNLVPNTCISVTLIK